MQLALRSQSRRGASASRVPDGSGKGGSLGTALR
jgi:hypothetical protein